MTPDLTAQQQTELIAEARQLNEEERRSDPRRWRLAEIAFLLNEGGMSRRDIAAQAGYAYDTIRTYMQIWQRWNQTEPSDRPRWAEAYERVRNPANEPAVDAIAERDSLTYASTQRVHRAEVKAIVAQLTDLPPAEKVQLARELAQDREFRLGSDVERAERAGRIRESYGAEPRPRPERDWDREVFEAINTIFVADTAHREGRWEPSPMTQYGFHLLRQYLASEMTLADQDQLVQETGFVADIEDFLKKAAS